MKYIDLPHEDEYLPIFQPQTRSITDIANRKIVHERWLHHGHINVWVPGIKDGTVYKQIKRKSHWKADATIGGHIDCTKEDFWEIMGRDIAQLAPKTAVKEWREETGLDFTEDDIIPLGSCSETWNAPHPESKYWNNGIVIAYLLGRRVTLPEMLDSPYREDGLDFEEISIEELLGLQEGAPWYLWKITSKPYRDILFALKERLKNV